VIVLAVLAAEPRARALEEIMKSRLLVLPLIVFGAVVLTGACTVTTTGPGGVVEITCTDDGDTCNTDDDCCSDVCADDGTCATPVGGCLEDNSACDHDDECCSAICADDGYCGLPG
jgi:hypothetical protein